MGFDNLDIELSDSKKFKLMRPVIVDPKLKNITSTLQMQSVFEKSIRTNIYQNEKKIEMYR